MEHINNKKFVVEAKSSAVTNPLLKAMHKNTSYSTTENGALTFLRSGSNLVDFFAQGGATRNNVSLGLDLFKKAYAEDPQSALRILFYLRDVRGGQGERNLFRTCLQSLGSDFPEVFTQIIPFVPEYGRWDDLFFDNPVCFAAIQAQLSVDIASEHPSLLAKWLPSINASSAKTRAKAKFIITKLGFKSEKEYRKTLSAIRAKLKVVEIDMSANKWGDINYSAVPSQASRIYKNAFAKHDSVRYAEFINKAEKGEVKINASTLYPYQIYDSVNNNYSKTLEALWNQLPDYTQGKNALVVADVSGSMYGQPMSVSVSLALYFAERNKGPFKDHFLTFTDDSRLQSIVGNTLKSRMNSIETADWGGSTNIQSAFAAILKAGTENNVSPEDMPSTIYIISDMEFNYCTSGTNFDGIKAQYERSGYKLPNIVFWNVSARQKNIPVECNTYGVALVSGFSPSVFRLVVENKTPEQVMFETINSERYSQIVIK